MGNIERDFKVGDRVRAKGYVDGVYLGGCAGKVIRSGSNDRRVGVEFDEPFPEGHNLAGSLESDRGRWCEPSELELININKTSHMKKITNFLNRSLDKNTKKLYQAGLINGDLEPTEEGRQELLAIEWFANFEALVKRADEIIAESEKEE